MPTLRYGSNVFDGTSGQGLLETEPFLPPQTEAYRVVSFRISLYADALAGADIPSTITFKNLSTFQTEVLIASLTITAGNTIAWDFPCDLLSRRDTPIEVVVNNGAALPVEAQLTWDFQITAPTRGGSNG